MIHNHWLSITHHDSQPLDQHSTPWFTNHLLSIPHHHSQPLVQHNSQWFTTTGADHGVLYWASCCESWWVMLSQWLCIIVSYAEPVVVNRGVWCWANNCDAWCVMLSQWLWFMVFYAEPMVVYNGGLCCVSGWESCCAIPSHWDSQPLAQYNTPWFTTNSSVLFTVILNHWLSIAHQESQSLAQHNTPWFTNYWLSIPHHHSQPLAQHSSLLSQWLRITVYYTEPLFLNHGVLYWASCCESWWVMLSQWLCIMVC
jgi:hypothetical protein